MGRLISTMAAGAVLVAVVAAAPAQAEDMMKSHILEADTVSSEAAPAAAAKADCLQKAEMEMDSAKKDEMMKACDAMQ